jgi:hypothetical protein
MQVPGRAGGVPVEPKLRGGELYKFQELEEDEK